VVVGGRVVFETPGPYTEGPFVYQQLAPLKKFDGRYPILGSWVVDGVACGLGIREGRYHHHPQHQPVCPASDD
jgi:glutathionylspermidine synthase